MSRERDYFSEFRGRYSVLDVWRMYCPQASEPKLGMNRSPLRDEKNGSFSIYEGGRKFKDHGWPEHSGDSVDFVRIALGTDGQGVRKEIVERLGAGRLDPIKHARRGATPAKPKPASPAKKIIWPGELMECGPEVWAAFAKRRGLTAEGIAFAVKCGILRFLKFDHQYSGTLKCFAITDDTRRSGEVRRTDGEPFGKSSKAYYLSGVQKDWLPGLALVKPEEPFVGIFITEGATDLLTAFDLYRRYRVGGGKASWIPAALLGAGCRTLAPDAADLIKGRRVRLCPDADEAGDKMVDVWRPLLWQLGCKVDVVRLARWHDLTNVKDTVKLETLFDVAA